MKGLADITSRCMPLSGGFPLPSKALDAGVEPEVVPDSHGRPQDVKLGAQAQALPDGPHVAVHPAPVDDRDAGRGGEHPGQDGDGGGLPRPVVTQQGRDLTLEATTNALQ
eukprot:scaffold151134_cov50-Prasinocladus_malaysianus.AAC.2